MKNMTSKTLSKNRKKYEKGGRYLVFLTKEELYEYWGVNDKN